MELVLPLMTSLCSSCSVLLVLFSCSFPIESLRVLVRAVTESVEPRGGKGSLLGLQDGCLRRGPFVLLLWLEGIQDSPTLTISAVVFPYRLHLFLQEEDWV